MSTYTYSQDQPEAGPSKRVPSGRSNNTNNGRNHNLSTNPQLSSEPWFAYPTPPPEVLDAELPPYMDSENYPMGHMLDRLARKAHGDLKTLVTETLPKLEPRQRPRQVINYATHTRQAVLKYLAVLRWKTQVDVPTIIPAEGPAQTQSAFPTPHSNGDSYSPNVGGMKGKGKMAEDIKPTMIRGKVTDAKRVTEYLQYQNSQHDMAIGHIQHAAKQLESLRVRNPDLLTALSLLTLGTYDRFPADLTEAFSPRKSLTNGSILDTLRRLDAHILYRLKCVDYVPPDLSIEKIKDGRAYVTGGNGSWRAELSMTGFGEDAGSRWWLTGVEWLWESRSDDKGKGGRKRFKGVERQEILDLVNREILPPEDSGSSADADITKDIGVSDEGVSNHAKRVDAPLVRLVNFIQHLSLTYQLEVLFQQAMTLSRERWRNHLLIEIDRPKKTLVLKYWIRPRTAPAAAQGKRPGNVPPPPQQAGPRVPMLGATVTISIAELSSARTGIEEIQKAIAECDIIPSERLLRLGLKVKWEIGEAGIGGGWKAGDVRDETTLRLDPSSLSIDDILSLATRDHAAHLTRHHAAPLIANRTPLIEPTLEATESRPLIVRIPIPSQKRPVGLRVSVSPYTGLLEIEDEGAKFSAGSGGDERGNRTRQATHGVNAGLTQLGEALRRLVIAIFTDGLENQMRQLGWSPIRKLPIKLNELATSELLPASTIFVPLPTCSLHHLVVRITTNGLVFELLRLARVPNQNGPGMKLAVDSRSPLPLKLLRQRRQDAKGKRKADAEGDKGKISAVLPAIEEPENYGFDVEAQDLKDLFILSNASVAKILVEQQLKDRSIPFTEKIPELSGPNAPRSSSAVAGMIATIVVKVEHLLQDGRAAEVAMPLVYLQIKDWWKGGKCQVVTILQLQHRPSSTTSGASPDLNDASTSTAARAEGISFDHATSVVKFTAKDIAQCVPAFLEQWERLSKVIMVAGDVSRLNKMGVFRDLHMLSFDLRTASFSYAVGFNASITYSPNSDSYECTFTRASPVNTPVTPTVHTGEASPHEMLAPLLSHKLNELTRSEDVKRGTVGKEFIALLRNTLPLLQEIDGIRAASTTGYPKLVVSSVEEYRLIWDAGGSHRYALTIHLIPNDRYLLIDASTPAPDGLVDVSCGPLTPIPDLSMIIDKTYMALRTSSGKEGKVLAIKMDQGESLAVNVGVIGEVVRGISAEIDGKLSGGKGSTT